ncbi:MAG TPA: hypothetical protein VFW11_14390 [Cyclobacteriaceae bacterium]|nr:hypothetical protein [Cyclobacteriaceae bacterium]
MNHCKILVVVLVTLFISSESIAQDKPSGDFTLKVNAEERFFLQDGLYDGQKRNYLSVAIQPEYSLKWHDDKFLLKASLFGRIDQYDSRRTHADIRELYWQMVQNNHELSIGIKKIFWGVTESAHIVNVINQTDIVENFDGEEKLGQPMIHYSYLSNIGTFDFFFMPYFRKPVYPGKHGRLRTPFVINDNMISFESRREEYRPDVAFRWSHYVGKFDFGVSHFYGTSRQPLIESLENFQPVFAIINQTGIDVQATTGPVLWKLESVYNTNNVLNYTSLAVGFEYTFSNLNGNGLDMGFLSEYLYDSRDELTFNSLQNDLFAGTRLAFNNAQDTQVLAGAIIDLEHSSLFLSLEASQRIKESWKVELEGRLFPHVSNEEFAYFIRSDSFIRLSVNKYF